MAALPAPDVTVTTNGAAETHVVVSRNGSDGTPLGKSYKIEGGSENEKIGDAVRKVLNDPYSAEWIPK